MPILATPAQISPPPAGCADRLDRFVEGHTKYGQPFTRPATGKAPVIVLPKP